jgi:hypothetical protein
MATEYGVMIRQDIVFAEHVSHPVSEIYAVGVPSRPRSFAGGRLDRIDFDLNTIAMTTALAGRCPAWRPAGRRYA